MKIIAFLISFLFIASPLFAQDVKDITLEQLKQQRPDLVEK